MGLTQTHRGPARDYREGGIREIITKQNQQKGNGSIGNKKASPGGGAAQDYREGGVREIMTKRGQRRFVRGGSSEEIHQRRFVRGGSSEEVRQRRFARGSRQREVVRGRQQTEEEGGRE